MNTKTEYFVQMKEDYEYTVNQETDYTDPNSYFFVLLSLQNMGYNLQDIIAFQELQEFL